MIGESDCDYQFLTWLCDKMPSRKFLLFTADATCLPYFVFLAFCDCALCEIMKTFLCLSILSTLDCLIAKILMFFLLSFEIFLILLSLVKYLLNLFKTLPAEWITEMNEKPKNNPRSPPHSAMTKIEGFNDVSKNIQNKFSQLCKL
jgi:hypothetical protein